MSLTQLNTFSKLVKIKRIKPDVLILKEKYMKRRFVNFKRIVLLNIQLQLFVTTINKYFKLINKGNDNIHFINVTKLFNYIIYYSIDILYMLPKVYDIAIDKLHKMYIRNKLNNNISYSTLLKNLHITCNYYKRDGDLCEKNRFGEFYLCKMHLRCQYNKEITIKKALKKPINNKYLIDIILGYDNICYV